MTVVDLELPEPFTVDEGELMTARGWLAQALCAKRGIPADDYFNETYLSPRAAAACTACSVRKECLEYAIHHDQRGWWAGTSYAERRQIRRERRITSQRDLPRTTRCPGCLTITGVVPVGRDRYECLDCGSRW